MTPLNILIAFPYFTKQITETLRAQDPKKYRLMIDSGAFTAHMGGKAISLDDYCKFLDSVSDLKFDAVQLDVIGDHEASLKNFEIMSKRGYKTLPVFTRGAPPELLDHLFTLSDYVLIGGVAVGESRQGYVKWLASKIQGKRVHLLGFTNLDFVKMIRPFSIDSSGWESGGRFGNLHFYQGMGQIKTIDKAKTRELGLSGLVQLGLQSGLTAEHLKYLGSEGAWAGGSPTLGPKATVRWLGGFAYVALSQDIERNLGTRSYLALAGDGALKILFNAYELYQQLHHSRYTVGSTKPASRKASRRS